MGPLQNDSSTAGATSLRVIDLTRVLDEKSVLWPGTPPLRVESSESIDADGSFTRRVSLDEHSGTHFDAPSHFVSGAAHVADVAAETLVRPLRVIDFTAKCAGQPDATLSVADMLTHEAVHGVIADGSAVFLRTDWVGDGDTLRFPGFGVDAATFLAVERGVAGLGIDTLGIDAGYAVDFPVHREVTLPRGIWHLENLTNLAAVPSAGAWVAVGVPRIAGASGFPARVFALLGESD
ncbi:MAG: cyclase family protein [Actinomycetes bacterium]